MEAIINVVLPVFAIIASGWVCGRIGLLGDGASQALNGFVYYAALPALCRLLDLPTPPSVTAEPLPLIPR